MIVYLGESLSEEGAQEIADALQSIPAVSAARYVSDREAHARVKTFFGGGDASIANIDPSFFPKSLEVRFKEGVVEIASLHPLTARLSSIPGVEEVEYLGNWSAQLNHLVGSLKRLFVFCLLLFALVSFLITILAQRLGTRAACMGLGAMRLGATPLAWFASGAGRGIATGAVGAAIALLLSYLVYLRLADPLSELLLSRTGSGAVTFLSCADMVCLLVGSAGIGAIGGGWAGALRRV